jgi:hypothetical protein
LDVADIAEVLFGQGQQLQAIVRFTDQVLGALVLGEKMMSRVSRYCPRAAPRLSSSSMVTLCR